MGCCDPVQMTPLRARARMKPMNRERAPKPSKKPATLHVVPVFDAQAVRDAVTGRAGEQAFTAHLRQVRELAAQAHRDRRSSAPRFVASLRAAWHGLRNRFG